ncbi:putative protein phosphatase 4 core regulatory subunit r2 protein [Neofusicoccum parvum UCRNP2]|uniref:Protein phosphatase 4 core regulatory subunit R2 n=1 Tax=Botryosphaeria parva (strain UCR-NP2) TaxID=1287680 RepID=R1GMY0_BOTPV|nr:putative protein phosphatase 4 core regulatory subunit r2 protein [Neofusicoccum parvum UCRNP2]
MLSGEQLLEQAAKDGSMVSEEWPRALEVVLSRLEHIVYNEFPTPTVPPPTAAERDRSKTPSKPEGSGNGGAGLSQETQTADKENAPPAGGAAAAAAAAPGVQNTPSPRPGMQTRSASHSQREASAATAPTPTTAAEAEEPAQQEEDSRLPAELATLYAAITGALRKQFATEPPHTVQRLADLVLAPRTHYRFLPPYLRALDRVVSVSSTTGVFPLPQAVVPVATGILNGITPSSSTTASSASSSSSSSSALGSDESLGGALLTPIPWLQNREGRGGSAGANSELVSESTEMVDGPNGAGRIETVSVVNGVLGSTATPTTAGTPASGSSPVAMTATAGAPAAAAPTAEALREAGAVTQGELLRQEQEAGVVPVGQSNPRNRSLLAGGAGVAASTEQKEGEEKGETEQQHEDVPHARGPDELGVEDMGPQASGPGSGINLEAAVGRAPVATTTTAAKKEDEGGEEKEKKPEQPLSPEAEMKDVGAEGTKEEEGKEKSDEVEEAKKEGESDDDDEEEEEEEGKKKEGEEEGKTADTEMTD